MFCYGILHPKESFAGSLVNFHFGTEQIGRYCEYSHLFAGAGMRRERWDSETRRLLGDDLTAAPLSWGWWSYSSFIYWSALLQDSFLTDRLCPVTALKSKVLERVCGLTCGSSWMRFEFYNQSIECLLLDVPSCVFNKHLKHPVVRQMQWLVAFSIFLRSWILLAKFGCRHLIMNINYSKYHNKYSNVSDSTWELYFDAKGEVLAEWKHGTSLNAS